jgi:hypothetical protein
LPKEENSITRGLPNTMQKITKNTATKEFYLVDITPCSPLKVNRRFHNHRCENVTA